MILEGSTVTRGSTQISKYFQEASPERTLVFSVLPRATVLPKKDIILELLSSLTDINIYA